MDRKTITKLQELNINTRKIEMYSEMNRLASFAKYPSKLQSASRLAKAGFYYTGTEDEVECFQCGLKVTNWLESDIPEEVHKRKSRKCKFLNDKSKNVPFTQQNTGSNSILKINAVLNNAVDNSDFTRPVHQQYSLPADRFRSFRNFPLNILQTPEELACAGFYYTGTGDQVKCFFCDGGLRNWEPSDNPWTEHARWFPRCGYLRQCKGDQFIKKVQGRYTKPVEKIVFDTLIFSTAERQEYCLKFEREKSFERISHRMVVTPEIMSNAGFYYTGVGDHVECFFCAGNLTLSEVGADPWRVHSGMFPNCGFVRMKEESSMDYQNVSKSKTLKQIKDNSTSSSSSSEEDKSSDNKTKKRKKNNKMDKEKNLKTKVSKEESQITLDEIICKVCLDEEISIMFLKCRHLVCCYNCAPAMKHCPVCREVIVATVRVFL